MNLNPRHHVAHIVASMNNPAAGPSYSVKRLAESVASTGFNVTTLTVGNAPIVCEGSTSIACYAHDGVEVPMVRDLYFSKGLNRAIRGLAQGGALLHAHGLWLMPNVYPARAAKRFNSALLHSPRGMLGAGALQFSTFKKRVFSCLLQRNALEAVTCFHATSEQEYEDIRRYGLSAPVAIIPNGIDMPDARDLEEAVSPKRRSLLYLGRVHPKKGIDRLLVAWSRIEAEHADWDLKIIGPSEGGHKQALSGLSMRLGLQRVTFHPGLFGPDKEAAYRAADLFVLPTLDENFGMVVAEALANGTPVISTKGAPWEGLDKQGCGWWIDHSPEALAEALRKAMALPRITLKKMGLRGRDWMQRDFSWDRIAADMAEVYSWCLGKAEAPSTIRDAAEILK